MPILAGVALLLFAARAWAHAPDANAATSSLWHWTFEPWVIALLSASLALYLVGAYRLKSRTHREHTQRVRLAWFAGGWLALAAALVSPIDALGVELFSAHMVQHELFMIVAAPMLVLARPLSVWTWAFPARARHALAGFVRQRALRALWRALTEPTAAWIVHALALWLWHVPAFFEAALADNTVHTWQHASFLVSALFFWWTVLGQLGTPQRALLYLFTTMIHTGALGALLTFSSKLWYASYALSNGALGFDPLQDQQLGGLIMWIPGGLVYVLAALALSARLLRLEPRGIVISDT